MNPSSSSSSSSSSPSRLWNVLEVHPVMMGLTLRLILAWLLPTLLDVHGILPGVAYTDIDYSIFVDAATHVRHGASPYDRHTYRYTPFLAAILAKLPHYTITSRFLFCVADALCGWIILNYRQAKRQRQQPQQQQLVGVGETLMTKETTSSSSNPLLGVLQQLQQFLTTRPQLVDALWWLYNPLAINICTRGSSESFQVLLPVLVTVTIVTRGTPSWQPALVAGFCHGVAVHSKLYPIIYSLSFMTYFAPKLPQQQSTPSSFVQTLIQFALQWAKRLLTPPPLVFFVTFMITFVGLQYAAYIWYGPVSLQEGLLYHFSRVDHRHNYAMHWYWIYLGRARPDFAQYSALVGRALLVPQLILLVYTSLVLAPRNLGLALFIQTYLFVTQNKVITAQYLTWYLCLLPLCSDAFDMTPRLGCSLVGLALSYGLWLGSAYCLEMQGWAVHRLVWMASVVYFGANVSVIGALLNSYHNQQQEQQHNAKKAAGDRGSMITEATSKIKAS